LALSDRVAVMRAGAIVQIGTPKQIYYSPADQFVATFIGRSNLLQGTLARDAAANSSATVETVVGPVECRFPSGAASAHPIAVLIRPEHIAISADDGDAGAALRANQFRGRVANVVFLGEITEYLVQVGERAQLIVRGPIAGFAGGESVIVAFPPERTLGLPNAEVGPRS
jgi:ABC-type Fe3+/spermidine/putrescine transport system ATPase subunit